MLEDRNHWEDVGYDVLRGTFREGDETVVERPAANSPLTVSREIPVNEMIKMYEATKLEDEVGWCVNEIQQALGDGLRPDDCVVITLDDRNARVYCKALAERLGEAGIRTNNLLADPFAPPSFMKRNFVTLTTVYRAKGNEAALVCVVGADAITPDLKRQVARNKLFTAFTRAKAWLRVSGISADVRPILQELEVAKAKLPRLEFVYPDTGKIPMLQRNLDDRASKLRKLSDEMDRQMGLWDMSDEERRAWLQALTRKK
jgi:superfamily I DNA and RNA helicase